MGEIFWYVSDWLLDDDQPNSVAQRIVAAKQKYGQPSHIIVAWFGNRHGFDNIWVSGLPASTVNPSLINLFHSVGIKVFQQIMSAFYSTTVRPLPLAEVKSYVDQTLALGQVDGFYIDEVGFTNDPSDQAQAVADYQTLSNHIHSKGKLVCFNVSAWPCYTSDPSRNNVMAMADIVHVEEWWRLIPSDLLQSFPNKFYGWEAPHGVIDWDTRYQLTTWEQAIADTKEAFNMGIGYFMAKLESVEQFLSAEFENYMSQFAPTPPPVLPYPCPFCDLAFATEAELAAHITTTHPQLVYVCPQCGAQFATPEELTAHIAAVHPTPTPSPSGAARVPCFGNRALVQVYLRRLRDKVFSKRQHERLHPII